MQVYIVFGLGLGADELQWEVCDVKLSAPAAEQRVAELTADTGCEYKYEEFTAS